MTPEQKHRLYIDELNYYFHGLGCYGTIMEIMDDKYDLMFLEKIYNLLFLDIIDYHCSDPEYLAYKGLYYQNKKIDSLAKKYYIEAIEQENVLAMYLLGMFSKDKKKTYYLNMAREYETRLGVSYKASLQLDRTNKELIDKVFPGESWAKYRWIQPYAYEQSDKDQPFYRANKNDFHYLNSLQVYQDLNHFRPLTTIYEIFNYINNILHYISMLERNWHGNGPSYIVTIHTKNREIHATTYKTVLEQLINHKDILQTTNLMYIKCMWKGLAEIDSSYMHQYGLTSYKVEGINHLDKKVAYIDALISHGYRNLKKITPERPRLIELANDGNIEAMIILNEHEYLEKAVELGSVHAMLQLGNWYRENTENVKLMNKYYRMAIDMGDEEALLYLSNPVIDYDKIIEDNKKLKQMVDDLMRMNDALERTVETYHYKFTH
jgi:hypothetical protein